MLPGGQVVGGRDGLGHGLFRLGFCSFAPEHGGKGFHHQLIPQGHGLVPQAAGEVEVGDAGGLLRGEVGGPGCGNLVLGGSGGGPGGKDQEPGHLAGGCQSFGLL